MKSILELRNISKEFKEPRKNIIALNGITLNLSEGKSLCLLGPSGSGKSTLLQIAALLDKPTKGEIFIDEKKCDHLSEEKKNLIRKQYIGFIYQNFYLLESFSALENIIIPQLINGSNFDDAQKKGKNLLTDLGLSKRLHNKPKELSGG